MCQQRPDRYEPRLSAGRSITERILGRQPMNKSREGPDQEDPSDGTARRQQADCIQFSKFQF